jgi:hypothetical protein
MSAPFDFREKPTDFKMVAEGGLCLPGANMNARFLCGLQRGGARTRRIKNCPEQFFMSASEPAGGGARMHRII